RAGIMRRLHRAVVDDGAEAIALGAADEEADVRVAAPFVAERFGAGDAGRGQERYRRQSAGKPQPGLRNPETHAFPPCPQCRGWLLMIPGFAPVLLVSGSKITRRV